MAARSWRSSITTATRQFGDAVVDFDAKRREEEELKQAFEADLLTEEEYKAKRAELLDNF